MILSINTTAQLLVLFLLYKTVLPHFFSPVEWLAHEIRYWLPEGTLQEPPTKKKKKGKKLPPSSKKAQNAKANLLLFSNILQTKQSQETLSARQLHVQQLQGYAQVDWRLSMVVCAVVLFITSEITQCLVPEETTLEVSTILLCLAAYYCIDYLLADLLRSDSDALWNGVTTYCTATFFALLACNAPLVLVDFRFQHTVRAGNQQYTILLHHLGLNTTQIASASIQDASTTMYQNFMFTFLASNLAGLVTSVLLKPSRVLAEAYVHRTDTEYTTSKCERVLSLVDLLFPILMVACWVPALTSDFFTKSGLIQCDKFSILRDCTPANSAGAGAGADAGADADADADADAGGVTETQWTSIRTTIVIIGVCLKLCMCRRNLQAYLDRARYQYDTFIASSGMATMERVRNVLQYRIRVLCPNMLALFAPYGFPLCLAMLLKQIQSLSFHTCSTFLDGLKYIGLENVRQMRQNNNTTQQGGLMTLLLDEEGHESVQWFMEMASTGRVLMRIYLEQMLSFLLFWSLASTFLMMCFFILSTNSKFEGMLTSPVTSLANQIKSIGADPKHERKSQRKDRKEQIKARKNR